MVSETAFDARLSVLWGHFFALQNHVGTDIQEPSHDLVTHPEEELDDASCMRLIYIKELCYEEQGSKNAVHYCIMRMYTTQEYMCSPGEKRPCFLDSQEYTRSDATNAFIERYTAFLEETYRGINRRLFVIVGILFLAVFLVLTLFLKTYFIIAALESIMLGMLTCLLRKRRMPGIFQKNQLNVVEKYVGQEVLEFNHPIYFP